MKNKAILLFIFFLLNCLNGYSQDWWGHEITNHRYERTFECSGCNYLSNTEHIELIGIYVNLKMQETFLRFEIYKVGGDNCLTLPVLLTYYENVPDTYIECCGKQLPFTNIVDGYTISKSSPNYGAKDYEKIELDVRFKGVLPFNPATLDIELHSKYLKGGFKNVEWQGLADETISHYYGFTHHTQWTETAIKQYAVEHNDELCGIYYFESWNRIGCVKENDEYKLIWLGTSSTQSGCWNIGDCFAVLHPTAAENTFLMDYLDEYFSFSANKYACFSIKSDRVCLSIPRSSYYIKYPKNNSNNSNNNAGRNNNGGSYSNNDSFVAKWTGTGFALNRGYIATNQHVIDGARNIKVYGVKGNFNVGYNAQVVLSDAHNDLAVLKINDSRFTSFGTIPYRVKTTMAEVGDEVFILGYPMTSTMGEEIKLTTGVISARSGFQGDLSLYQTTAPIQPGNSGGPLFDNSGNLIGIVNAKHKGAENVGYAIKSSYLSNLIQSGSMSGLLPQTNSISGQSLSGKVKSVKNFVFLIKCN